ncbi:MAG: helix-turn-helix domain-containing protein [Rhodobacteraceae bacterium]|nr:helix-turn-helix domain-containing protein [Paracoccaceae bacterium]
MGNRKIDARRIKIHRSYSADEAAKLLGLHKNTVKNWMRAGGLPFLTDARPFLILGRDLKQYLYERRQAARKPCAAGELFCLKCRMPRRPAGGLLDYEPFSPTTGNLKGICEACDTFIYRRIARTKIAATFPDCHVAFPQYQRRLTELI